MKKTAAELVRFALEQIGVEFTFGIPGVHNTEIYDQLNMSNQIDPVLVTHESAASFMADAVSRSGKSIGTCVIVPAAGVTHAASGIAEAYLDGIPMLVISGGIRSDADTVFQLHDIDQHAILKPMTKGTWLVEDYESVIPTIYEAYETATCGEPGPVFVEIPVNLQAVRGQVQAMPEYKRRDLNTNTVTDKQITEAAKQLLDGKKPGIFIGWGASGCAGEIAKIAEMLAAPLSSSLQGLGVFPASHPLHTGMCFGPAAVPAAENAFADCDAMLAIGVRFAEIATGSYGKAPPNTLVHIDINPDTIGKNYPASVALVGDAKHILPRLRQALENLVQAPRDRSALQQQIREDKARYFQEWENHKGDGVNPFDFFKALRKALPDDGIVVTDDGNHTFLTAELMPIHRSGGFFSPTDFNCMGYCVPATNGVKLANKDTDVVGIVGDGAFLMTGMEALTACTEGLGVTYFVFNDGELSQIAQAQDLPYNRKTCTILGNLNTEGVALATGAAYLEINDSQDADATTQEALNTARREKRPVIVNVRIDYSKQTRFTKGAVKASMQRFDTPTKLRFIGRALVRKVTG